MLEVKKVVVDVTVSDAEPESTGLIVGEGVINDARLAAANTGIFTFPPATSQLPSALNFTPPFAMFEGTSIETLLSKKHGAALTVLE